MAHQSLYRRYRSQKFSEIVGQSHITSALRTAVAEGRHGHAYLFSGPRGTGKTSTARILAKALNCPNVTDGEPCATCESCLAIEHGTSFDLHELDAASHNKVDDIRDLISRVNLGSPGRTKVYILDEVHMLSAGAENALLKTLEEPPDHVVFVLATTEPHKVVPTIRSRTQRFEFHLLPADELAEHVRWIIADAGLDVGEDAIDYVLAQGGGSARDTLSVLDMVAAAGGVPDGSDVGVALTRAIGAGDAAAAIAAVQEGLTAGQEPRTMGEATIEVLRNTFLVSMGAPLHHLNDRARELTATLASELGPATLTRALESLGQALVEMRQAPDPRVPLEVALLRLCRGGAPLDAPAGAPTTTTTGASPDTRTDASAGASGRGAAADPKLVIRVGELERQVAELTTRLAEAISASADALAAAGNAAAPPSGPAAAARDRLSKVTGRGETAPSKAPPSPRSRRSSGEDAAPEDASPPSEPSPPPPSASASASTSTPSAGSEPATPPAPTGPAETRPALSAALTLSSVDAAFAGCLEGVSQKTRVRFKGGRILDVEGSTVIFGVPNQIHRDRCHDLKAEIEQVLSAHFGQAVTLDVIVDGDAPTPTMDPARIEAAPPPSDDVDDVGPVEDLANATDQSANGVERLTKAFPGSKVVEANPDDLTP